jgi:hypothetical protein
MAEREPIVVFVRYPDGTEKVTGHACPECKTLSSVAMFLGTDEEKLAHTVAAAKRCCNPTCKECGAKTRRYCTLCDKCRTEQFNEKSRKEEAKRRAKATRVSAADYEGGVFRGDRFFMSVGEMLDDCDDDRPADVWGAQVMPFHIDAGDVVESELSNHHDDAGEDIGEDDLAELQKLLDAWCEGVGVVSYEADYGTLVVLLTDSRGRPLPKTAPKAHAGGLLMHPDTADEL